MAGTTTVFFALFLAAASGEVREVVIEGLVEVAPEVALEGIETRVGAPLDVEMLSRDLVTIWNKKLFGNVQVAKEKVGDGWRVVFTVVESPLVREIRFGGNDGLDDEELLDAISSRAFREPITEAAARADAERLTAIYRAKGYPRAEVQARIEPVTDAPGQADLLFSIREGPRARVATLAFDGNDEVPDEVILDALETCEAGLLNNLLRGCWYDEEALQTDLFRVQALYYDLGYVGVEVDVPEITFSDDATEVTVRIPVVEGGQYRFGRLAFSVEDLPPVFPVEKLQRLLGVESGDVFNRTRLFRGIERIQSAYRYEIQTIVAVTPESDLDINEHLVHLTFTIEPPGPRYPVTAPGQLLPQRPKPL